MYYFCPMQRYFFQRSKLRFVMLMLALLAAGCSPTRHLKEGEYFFTGYKIKSDNKSIDKDEYASYVRQKPNKKFFFLFRLQMGLYQMGMRGKDTSKFRKWLRDIGEEPVLLDTMLTHRSTNQLQILMNKKGYFNAFVKDSIIYSKKKAKGIYTIRSDVPYKINRIECVSSDTAIYRRLIEQQKYSLVQPGINYDESILDRERDRFATEMKALGYYFFTRQFITYTADTALSTHSVNLVMNVARLNEQGFSPSGVSLAEDHHQYHLNNIFIQTDYEPMAAASSKLDTSAYKSYFFLSSGDTARKRFRKDFLISKIFIAKGDMFNINDVKNTYSRLTDLNVFRFVNIKFEEVPRDSLQQNYLLDVFVQLSPLPNNDFAIETEGTHNAGNLGLAGNLVYRNKNTFKGAELLEVKFKSAFEFQKTFSERDNRTALIFNTFEVGPELSLNLKKLILLNNIFRRAEREWNPKAKFSTSVNYQQRPDYTRSVFNMRYSEQLKTTAPWRVTVDLADISIVNVNLSQSFQDKLDLINDKGLTYSYSDHVITNIRLSLLKTSREEERRRNFGFLQINIEYSGFVLSQLSNADKFLFLRFNSDSNGYIQVNGINYAEGLKTEVDWRWYQNFAAGNVLAYRGYIGAGFPGKNSITLPFEKSFYGGGSNDIRAWQFRTLGPGSYSNPIDIEQTGEFKVEGNIELRSGLMKYVEGAAFVDAGNIWLLNKDNQRPGGELEFEKLIPEMAIGGGIGIRFNFNYFILRLDGAVKLHDPARIESERWVYGTQKFSVRDINYNIGIGYPF
jgi:outer membrane protein assembly factor BamA